MNLCRTSLPLLSLFFVLNPLTASPQSPELQPPEPRLHGAIRGDAPAVLPGSISPRIRHAQDLGPAAASQPLHGITLVFRRSEAQQADLDHLLNAQQDPASPDFHHWLTPEAFGARFGMADADLDATQRWLIAQGFTISSIAHARDRITFSGTAAQVAAAFHTTLHHYQVDGELHLAPNSDLALPADLAAVTTAVLHLSDFRPRPNVHLPPRPAYTTGVTETHYLVPPDLAVMYDLPPATSVFNPGEGQTLAVVGQSFVDVSYGSAVRNFLFGSNGLTLTPVLVPNTGVEAISPGDATESEIDLEYTSGLLNAANVVLVYVGSDPTYSVFDALAFAIDHNVAPVVSISYGECETFLSPSDLAQGTSLFQQAASQGQTLVASSGDSGSTACAPFTSTYLTTAQLQALAVNYPADSPYVTAVGGTQMAPGTFAAGTSTYWGAPPISGNDLSPSLLSYVPETTWNEGSTSLGILAGGGGPSTLIPRPTWQTSVPGIPAGTTRLLPDIALQASAFSPGFLFCSDDGGSTSFCNYGVGSPSNYSVGGGTSFAAPTFAAMVALLNQSTQTFGQGNMNPVLYRLAANSATAASVFHDITTGSIACTPGAAGCSAAGESGFAATAGYDQATGLGSLDFLHLQAALPGGSPSPNATIVTLTPFSSALNAGDSEVISIIVSPVNLTNNPTPPTGTVSLAVDGVVLEPDLPIVLINALTSQSVISDTIYAPAATGSHVLVATYSGDATHGPSSATAAFDVGNLVASGAIAITAGSLTVPANGSSTTAVTATPSGGYDGRLFWSLSASGGDGTPLTGCYSIPTLPVQGVTSTTLAIGVGTACSSALPSVRGGALRLINTTHHTAANSPQPDPRHGTHPGAHPASWTALPIAAGLALCCLIPTGRRRRPLPLLSLFLAAAALTTLSGCGSSSTSVATNPQPKLPGVTYILTLTGQDSITAAITSSTAFNLTVQ